MGLSLPCADTAVCQELRAAVETPLPCALGAPLGPQHQLPASQCPAMVLSMVRWVHSGGQVIFTPANAASGADSKQEEVGLLSKGGQQTKAGG